MPIYAVEVTFTYKIPVFASDKETAEQIACEHKNEIEWFDADVDTCSALEVTYDEALYEFEREQLVYTIDGEKPLIELIADQASCEYCDQLINECMCDGGYK